MRPWLRGFGRTLGHEEPAGAGQGHHGHGDTDHHRRATCRTSLHHRRCCSTGLVTALSASAVAEMRAASLTARSIAGGFDRRIDQRVDLAFEHQRIDHAGRGAVADRDDHRVVRAAGNRREIFGAQAAQVGDENGARAGLEHGCGARQAVGVPQVAVGLEHGAELSPQVQVWRRDDGQRFLRLEGTRSGIAPGRGVSLRRGAKFHVLAWDPRPLIELVLSRSMFHSGQASLARLRGTTVRDSIKSVLCR